MKRSGAFALVVAATSVSAGYGRAATDIPPKIVDLGSAAGYGTRALGINDAGEILGVRSRQFDENRSESHGLVWRKGAAEKYTSTEIEPLPSHPNSYPAAINDAGRIAGWSEVADLRVPSSPAQVAMWQKDALGSYRPTDLGTPYGFGYSETAPYFSGGHVLNEAGQIVGGATASLPTRYGAYLWTDPGVLPPVELSPSADPNVSNQPHGINDHGTVVGQRQGNPPSGWFQNAAIWTAESGGAYVQADLPLPAGASSATAADVNNGGLVVGYADGRPVLWGPAAAGVHEVAYLELPSGPGKGRALAVNDAGDIVGWALVSEASGDRSHAVLWRRDASGAHVPTDLGGLPGFTSSVAYGVNEQGQVVGSSNAPDPSGGDPLAHAVLWQTGASLAITASKGRVSEADGLARFTVALTPPQADTVSVDWTTVDGLAVAGQDYSSAGGRLFFNPGETTKTISVSLTGDWVHEPAEAFGVRLQSATRASIARDLAVVTVDDDDVLNFGRPEPLMHAFFAVDTLETPYIGDFNGDGRTDIITFTRQNPLAVGDVYVALSEGTRYGPNTKWHDWFAITTDESVVIGDYDGDGKDDIATWLGNTTRQVYVALSYGTGMATEHVWADEIGFGPTDVLLAGDVDNDGRKDLVLFARSRGEVYVALSDGTKFLPPALRHPFFAVSTYERPRVADVNGDGRADIVTFATDSPTAYGDVYVALSDGTRFVDQNGLPGSSTKWHDWFAIRPTEEVRTGDLNGDGRDDFFTFLPLPWGQCYSVESLGTAMADNVLWPAAVLADPRDRPFTGDVDGDGRADVVVFAQGEGKVYVSFAGAGPPPTTGLRSETFSWQLSAGSRFSVPGGSVRAAEGPLEVTLDFGGDFIILACVGPLAWCRPMGGRPRTEVWEIPRDFPAGEIQARVYFNSNYTQPPGSATGTVRFTYKPQ